MKNCFYFDKIVVGSALNAFSYSYKNNLPLVINKLCPPHRFKPEEEQAWNKLYFLLSLAGLNILGDKVDSIRIDEKQLVIITSEFKVIKIQFNELIIFDDQSISGLPLPLKEENEYMVLDWMVAKPCAEHDKEHIFTDDKFVKDIYFYPTDRLDGNHANIKDLVAVSYLTKEQLKDFDYSDTYARFKTEKILKEKGLTGSKNGFQNGKQVTYALRLEVKKREIKKLKMHLYENTNNIKFKYKDELKSKVSLCSYTNTLNNILNVL